MDSDNYPSPPPASFSLEEVRAAHFRAPKIPAALASPRAILNSTCDMFADIGRYVLEQSGRADLLEV